MIRQLKSFRSGYRRHGPLETGKIQTGFQFHFVFTIMFFVLISGKLHFDRGKKKINSRDYILMWKSS